MLRVIVGFHGQLTVPGRRDHRGRLGAGRHEVGLHDQAAAEALVVAHPVRLSLHGAGRGVDEERDVVAVHGADLAGEPFERRGRAGRGCRSSRGCRGLLFSAINQGAVGTTTPLGSVVCCTDRVLGRPCDGGRARAASSSCASSAGAGRLPRRRRRARRAAGIGGGRSGAASPAADGGVASAPPSGGRACTARAYRSTSHVTWAQARHGPVRGTTYHSVVSWARSLPAVLRRPLSRFVHAAWDGACELGAIGPDDPRGRRFGRMGPGACILFPQGARLQRAPRAHRLGDHRRSLRLDFGRHGARPGDADRPGRLHRQSLPHRARLAHRGALGDHHRRRHPDGALRLHHRPEPHLRRPGRAHRAPMAHRGAGPRRFWKLDRGQRGGPPGRADRRARGRGGGRGGAGRDPGPLRGGRRARPASCGAGSRAPGGSPRRIPLCRDRHAGGAVVATW